MTSPTGSKRKLSYDLSFNADMKSTTPLDQVALLDLSTWSNPDPDARIDIILNLSLNEYVALANCIDVGRDIAYGDNSIYLWWVWVRCLQSMSICESIINCIENDADVRIAINSSVKGLTDVNGNPDEYAKDVFPPVANCDKDIIWGYCSALWDFINASNVDFLEQLNEATNQYEQVNTLLKLIPGFEFIPVSDVLDFIAQLGDYNLNAYNASITVGVVDEIKCDLFCIAVSNGCTISFGDVYEYMLSKFGGLNAPTLGATFLELVQFMLTGAYPNDRIVYLWSLVQLGLAFIGAEYLSIDSVAEYSIQAQIGNPDNDWSILCDVCPDTWSHEWLGGSGNPLLDGWVLTWGTYDSVNDRIVDSSGGGVTDFSLANFYIPVGKVSQVNTFSFSYDVLTSSARTQTIGIQDDTPVTLVSESLSVNGTVTGSLSILADTPVLEGYRLYVLSDCSNQVLPNRAYITKIIISGTGDDPFV